MTTLKYYEPGIYAEVAEIDEFIKWAAENSEDPEAEISVQSPGAMPIRLLAACELIVEGNLHPLRDKLEAALQAAADFGEPIPDYYMTAVNEARALAV